MNIFILDESPILAARAQHDRHVVKMILESCQMLSTACQEHGFIKSQLDSGIATPADLYKSTHMNHPASIWARASAANFAWLVIHLDALLAEYHRRFPGKTHACESMKFAFAGLAARLSGLPHPTKPHRGSLGFYTDDSNDRIVVNPRLIEFAMTQHTPFHFCGPDQYATASTIDSYRAYYLAEKAPGNRWTRPDYMPEWLTGHATIHLPPTQAPRKPRAVKVRQPFVIPPPHTQVPSVSKFLARLATKV